MKAGITILLIVLSLLVYGQHPLVKYEEINYFSTFEQQAFYDFFEQGKTNYFALFTALNPQINKSDFEQFVHSYNVNLQLIDFKKTERKKPKATIAYIYQRLHDVFLKKYEATNHFSDIFRQGQYNCVSSTALYGLIFQHFNIPFTIRENPTHVYLVTYPDTDKIMVESTAPGSAFYAYNEPFKKEFIKNLFDNKIIEKSEYEQYTVNDLFDKYYFNDEDISLRELVGVQYSNDAIYRIDDEDYKGAFAQLEKAWLFYPGEKIKYMLLSTGTQILTLNSYDKDPDLLGYLIKLSRYKELGITTEMVVGEFGKITEQLLLNNGQPEKYKRYYEELIAELDDQETMDEISFGYYYESGRVLYNDGHFSASLPYFEEAFTLKPGNLNVKSAFTNTLLQLGNAKRNNNELLEFVEKYSNKYTQLEKNGKFIHLMATAYLTAFMQSYQLNNTVEGDHYKKLFEELFQANPDMHLPVDKVAEAYSAAAVYYFRKGQKVRARQYIDDGLKVIPGNFELQQRQRMLR